MGRFAKRLRKKKYREALSELQVKTSSTMNMFDRLPEKCSVCEKPFNRKNKEQVMTWTVVVRGGEKSVRLFCPDCIEETKKVLPVLDNVKSAQLSEDGVLTVEHPEGAIEMTYEAANENA